MHLLKHGEGISVKYLEQETPAPDAHTRRPYPTPEDGVLDEDGARGWSPLTGEGEQGRKPEDPLASGFAHWPAFE